MFSLTFNVKELTHAKTLKFFNVFACFMLITATHLLQLLDAAIFQYIKFLASNYLTAWKYENGIFPNFGILPK